MRRATQVLLTVFLAFSVQAQEQGDNRLPVEIGPSTAPTAPTVVRQVEVVNFPDPQNVVGAVEVSNLPAVQAVSGSVSVSNLPTVQQVTGTVAVSSLPGAQEYAALQLPAFPGPDGPCQGWGSCPCREWFSEPFDVAGWRSIVVQVNYTADGSLGAIQPTTAGWPRVLYRSFPADPFGPTATPDEFWSVPVLGTEAQIRSGWWCDMFPVSHVSVLLLR